MSGAAGVERFAAEVGPPEAGPVVAVGGRTQWTVGGEVDPAAREVRAPTGVVAHEPADMTVRVRAGTTVAELGTALAAAGQCVALPDWPGVTVGGVLAVGRSGIRRLGWGPVRDTVLEVRFVTADGAVAKAGGPTVKNVSGFDLCRLLVGSLGTLGLLAEVVLRTRPVPEHEAVFCTEGTDPFALARRLYRPAAVLWDGATTWVLLDGHPGDVAEQARREGLTATDALPELPPQRWSVAPSAIRRLSGTFVAEIGVGVVHHASPPPTAGLAPEVVRLHQRLKANFDPTGRLAPGRTVLAAS